jgi:hypothetical protein
VHRCTPADYTEVVRICADAFHVGLLGSEGCADLPRAVSFIETGYARRSRIGMLQQLERLQQRKKKAQVRCFGSL